MTKDECKELDEWLAVNVLKWEKYSPGFSETIGADYCFRDTNKRYVSDSLTWSPTTDRILAQIVLDEIEDLEVWNKITAFLFDSLGVAQIDNGTPLQARAFINAPPDVLMQAVKMAVEER